MDDFAQHRLTVGRSMRIVSQNVVHKVPQSLRGAESLRVVGIHRTGENSRER